jgi:hypothetical protein
MSYESAIAEIEGYGAYILADSSFAGVGSPDTSESEGACFLREVRDVTVEAIRGIEPAEDGEITADAVRGIRDSDDLTYALDGCVPIYTGRLWAVFTDLALYHEEADEYTGTLTGVAMAVMAEVARRLSDVLIEMVADSIDRDSD